MSYDLYAQIIVLTYKQIIPWDIAFFFLNLKLSVYTHKSNRDELDFQS